MRITLDKDYDLDLDDALRMADEYLMREDVAEAKEIYTQIGHLHPRHPHVMHSLGVIASRQQDLPEAERLLTDSVAVDPRHAGAQHNLSLICNLLGKHGKALHHACLALTFDFENGEYWNDLEALLSILTTDPEAMIDTALVSRVVLRGLD